MDGTAKGGIAIAIQSELGIPVNILVLESRFTICRKFHADDFVNALFDIKKEEEENSFTEEGMTMFTLEKFEEASELVKKVTNPTKLVYSEYLSKDTGAKVYLKPENMQHTGAYKLRGAYYKISTLTPQEREKGLITASAGNHAQGVAYAAKAFGCKATIVMPTVTPLIKVNGTKNSVRR